MTQKEKARAYDEALERAKKYKMQCDLIITQDIFPELKENEDEKIRKALLSLFSSNAKKEWYDIPTEKILAWLEKQGEQKAFDYENANIQHKDFAPKVEPRFHEGDWVIDKQGIVHQIANAVENVTNHTYGYDIVGGGYFNDNTEGVRLWTIEDAKDGDVLQLSEVTAIFKKYIGQEKCICYCSISEDGDFEIPIENGEDNIYGCTDTTPATKEQRDTLLKAMSDAGWEFDFDKKELKKIYNVLEECEIENIEHGKYYYCIKDYYSGGCKRASKGEVVQASRGMSMMSLGVKANEYFMPVNTIKQMSVWSEEDEDVINKAESWLDTLCEYLKDSSPEYISDVKDVINKLKSLKPQNTWKPSDEQLRVLHDAAIYIDNSMFPYKKGFLMKLYKQLKKLK